MPLCCCCCCWRAWKWDAALKDESGREGERMLDGGWWSCHERKSWRAASSLREKREEVAEEEDVGAVPETEGDPLAAVPPLPPLGRT